MGHLHIGGREDAKCYGLYNLQVAQEWVRGCKVSQLCHAKWVKVASGPDPAKLLLLYSWVSLCRLHCTLPFAWLPPNWMAYIMQVAGCCGEESKADFLLDACRSLASAYWLNSCRTTPSTTSLHSVLQFGLHQTTDINNTLCIRGCPMCDPIAVQNLVYKLTCLWFVSVLFVSN